MQSVPVVWGSATPSVIEADTETVTLSWGSSGADYCEANGEIFPTSGSIASGPFPAGNHSQSFSCTNAMGSSHYTLYWSAEPPAPPTPVLHSFVLSPAVVQVTDPISLSWSSSHADTCTASTSDVFPANGSMAYPAGTLPAGHHTFSMYCEGVGGVSNTLFASITVEAPAPEPVLHAFAFSASTIYQDDSVSVSWNSSDADICTVAGQGNFPASGTEVFPANSFPVGVSSYTMSCSGQGGTSNAITDTLTVLEPLPPVPSVPDGLASTDTNPFTGASYTISWGAVTGATSYQLHQNGAPTTISGTSQAFSQSNTGTYSYQVSACNSAGCSAQSAAISVLVDDPPPPDPLFLIGFDGEYSGFWPVSSSSSDLYIVRNNADGNHEGVTHFILVEQPDGSYTLNANPTAAQISQFDLTTPAAIAYELADINLDGAMDMVLLDSANVASGIVYASTSSNSAPIAYKHIDEEFIEFFADLYQGILDPDYFYDTAYENNWGTWTYSPDLEFLAFNTVMLHKSGQLFRPGLINYPPQEPISGTPFYTDISEAYDGENEPYWCDETFGFYGFNQVTGSWWVEGWYLPAWFTPDYSYFNEDAMEVAAPIVAYLDAESSATIPAIVFQILEDILGTNHDLDDEPAIYNLIRRMGQVLFGFGVEQEAELPQILAKVELLYTELLGGVVPYARHAYLQVTFPNGNRYMTGGWPEDEPTFPPFGYLATDWALNPTNQEEFEDYGKYIVFRQLVGHTTLSEASISGSMNTVTAIVNSCDIPYWLVTNNSNAYAFQSVPVITGLPRPRQQAWAPGSGATIPCP